MRKTKVLTFVIGSVFSIIDVALFKNREGFLFSEEFVEEAKELPKTIKLDEGLTIAQKFARLM